VLWFDHEMGEGSSDGVDYHTSQLPTGTVTAGDFAPDDKFCRFAHD
jgi:hypothetical protein